MKYLYLFSLIVLAGCKTTSDGYANLDELYADFVTVIKANDTNSIKQYCYKITPDAGTVAFMKDKHFAYRGIPTELEKQKIEVAAIGEQYFKQVAWFREKLVQEGQLANLKYVGREHEGEEMFAKELDIPVTETFIILTSGNDTIRCKLGEMLKVNGVWKSFTEPKLAW